LGARSVRHVVTRKRAQDVSTPPNRTLNLQKTAGVCCQFAAWTMPPTSRRTRVCVNALFSGGLHRFYLPLQGVWGVAVCPITRQFLWFLLRIERDKIANLCDIGEGLLLLSIKIISL
jgi:hypothetical protein